MPAPAWTGQIVLDRVGDRGWFRLHIAGTHAKKPGSCKSNAFEMRDHLRPASTKAIVELGRFCEMLANNGWRFAGPGNSWYGYRFER